MKGKVHWPLLVFYCSFEGWVLAFPLFGPLLGPIATSYKVSPNTLATTFLFFFAAFFAIWGIILRYQSTALTRLRVYVIAAIVLSGLLQLGLLAMPPRLWIVVFALFGILASFPSLVWLSFVSQGMDRKIIGWNLGIIGVFVELIAYIVRTLGQYLLPRHEFYFIELLPLIATLTLLRFPEIFSSRLTIDHRPQRRAPGRWTLYLFIFSFPLVGGIMYAVVQPLFHTNYPRLLADYGTLPYVLTMPIAGYLADKKNIRPVAFYGLAALGVGYTVFVLSTSGIAAFVGDTFINIGFAFMDLFVLFVLAWYAPRQRAPMYIGGGLAVYIASILVGAWLTELIVPHTQGNYKMVYLMAIIIMFVSFFLLEWVVKKTDAANLPYEAIGEDLELARGVQQNMFPQQPDFPDGWNITCTLEVAREVGGDFYDVIAIREEQVLFVIGDVMGKGLSAAMLVSSVLGQIRSLAENRHTLPELLTHVNRVLIRDARFSMYVTLGLVLLDKRKGTLTYASAGHMHPYILRGGTVRELEVSSFPLGTDVEAEYRAVETEFIAGDLLLLYTDGVVEAKNKRKELYGFERLETQLSLCSGLSAEEVNAFLTADLKSFTGTEPLEDDFTLLVVQAKSDPAENQVSVREVSVSKR